MPPTRRRPGRPTNASLERRQQEGELQRHQETRQDGRQATNANQELIDGLRRRNADLQRQLEDERTRRHEQHQNDNIRAMQEQLDWLTRQVTGNRHRSHSSSGFCSSSPRRRGHGSRQSISSSRRHRSSDRRHRSRSRSPRQSKDDLNLLYKSIKMYDGKGDFLDWIRGVELQASINNWSPEAAGDAARRRLVDTAAAQLINQGLNRGPVTIKKLVDGLKPFFPSKHTNSLDALLNIKLGRDEHVRDYAKRLEDAFLHHSSEFEDKTRLDIFCRGLESRLSYTAVDNIKDIAKTMKDAVEMAVTKFETAERRGQSFNNDDNMSDTYDEEDYESHETRQQDDTNSNDWYTDEEEYCDSQNNDSHSTEDNGDRPEADASNESSSYDE